MKLKNLLVAALLMVCAAVQAQMGPIPVDKDVRIGKLDNGLTYYIRHNNWPENRANFYIAQNVGSIQEEESQRGLAHFLEHMCFNGTDNFPGNGVIRFCESIGVEFGNDLNAFTSIDKTVYNYSQDSGITSKNQITNLERWEKVCSTSSVFTLIFSYLDEHPFPEDSAPALIKELRAICNTYLASNINQLKRLVTPSLQAEAYAILCDYWGEDYVKQVEKSMKTQGFSMNKKR